MIFRDAMRSLKDDPAHTFFYLLTFFITTMFMFLFFNIAECEMAVNQDIIMADLGNAGEYMANGDIANVLSIYVVVLCCVDIIFANRFFIRNKAPELAVRMICGAAFTQMTAYLFLQTTVLLLIALPLGILAGAALIPVLNRILAVYLSSPFTVTITSGAIVKFTAILVTVLFWTTTLNLSYVYQNEASKILNGMGEETDKEGSAFGSLLKKIPGFLKGIAGIVLFLLPLSEFIKAPGSAALWVIVGMLGLEMMVSNALLPGITKVMKKKALKMPVKAVVLGLLRDDFTKMKITLYLFIGNAVLLTALLVSRMDNAIAQLLILVTYAVMNFLQAMTIMFHLQTLLSSRNNEFHVLDQLGFSKKQCFSAIRKEMIWFHVLVGGTALLYMAVLLTALVTRGVFTAVSSFLMILVMLVPLLIAGIISFFIYRKAIQVRVAEGQ